MADLVNLSPSDMSELSSLSPITFSVQGAVGTAFVAVWMKYEGSDDEILIYDGISFQFPFGDNSSIFRPQGGDGLINFSVVPELGWQRAVSKFRVETVDQTIPSPTFIAASTAFANLGENLVIPTPVGTEDGDFMLFFLTSTPSQFNGTLPPGWTSGYKRSLALQLTLTYHHYGYRIASAEPPSRNIAMFGNGVELCAILTYRPAFGTQLDTDFNSDFLAKPPGVHQPLPITTINPDAAIISYHAHRRDSGLASILVPPPGMVERVNFNSPTLPELQMIIYDAVQTVPGPWVGPEFSSEVNTDGAAITVALRAAV